MVDARQGLGAFSSLPVNRQIAIGAPDHELAVVPEASRLVSADALVPYDDAPPHPAGHLHGVRHRGEISPVHEHLQDPPLPGLLPQLAAHPSHKGREAPLVHVIAGEGREPGGPVEVVVGVLGRRAGLAVAGMSSAGGVGRIAEDQVHAARLHLFQHCQTVAMQESYHPKTSPRWVTPIFLK